MADKQIIFVSCGLSMQVTSAGARLEYDCAEGAIEEPLRPDAEGRFTAAGIHTPGHGGPIREGEILPTFRARYEGHATWELRSPGAVSVVPASSQG